jgi:hypothetical protein
MSDTQQHQGSEVARLLAQIRQNYEAAYFGLSGLAQGNARHDFINKKMEDMGKIQVQLGKIIGHDPAMALIVEHLADLPDRIGSSSG